MASPSAKVLPFVPRMLNRAHAAAYVGVGTTKFDELVRDGRMPRPRCIDARRLWDVRSLDEMIDDLPIDGESHVEIQLQAI